MTIDLGFAWMTLPDNEHVAIVDVPGHEDFIENMLAGVSGLDAFLLVIAADEGVMPQTREHLAILRFMGLRRGVVALTKTDLAERNDWLSLVEADVRRVLATYTIADAPLVRVSVKHGQGLADVRQALARVLASQPPPRTHGPPVLPIDRVFTIHGFGTVVTGTLSQGRLQVGAVVELQPQGLQTRIRGLQIHNQPVDTADAGSRVAANLVGIDKQSIGRGSILSEPGVIQPTTRLDASYHHLPDAVSPLKHGAEVKLFVGPAEGQARVRLLSAKALHPNENGFVQLHLKTPLPIRTADRFVIRLPSPPRTIGGGVILDSQPPRRWQARDDRVIWRFETLASDDPARKLALHIQEQPWPQPITHFDDQALLATAIRLWGVRQQHAMVFHPVGLARIVQRMTKKLTRFHAEHPLSVGMPRAQFLQHLGAPDHEQAIMRIVLASGPFDSVGPVVRLRRHRVALSKRQQGQIDALVQTLQQQPFTPPSYQQMVQQLGDEDLLQTVIIWGDLVLVPPRLVLLPATYHALVGYARTTLEAGEILTVAAMRDHFGSSRRIILPVLDFLSQQGITRRVNAGHTLHQPNWERVQL